jgi:hypothetical protein
MGETGVASNFDRTKTLQELEKSNWGEPNADSHLVATCHRLRRVPLHEFTTEDLRIMISQGISLPYLIPLAVEELEQNPLAGGDYYSGDLLNAVLGIEESFWVEHADICQRVRAVVTTH